MSGPPSALLAACSSALYGSADFLGGLASRRTTALQASLWSQAFGLALLAVALAFVPGTPRTHDVVWGAVSGLAGSTGVLLLYLSLARYTMSTVAPMISVIALAVPVAAGVLLGERPGPAAIAGIVLGALAVVLVSRGDDHTHTGRPAPRGVPAEAWASGVLVGAFLVCLGQVHAGSGLMPIVAGRITGVATFVLIGVLRRAPLAPPVAVAAPVLGAGFADVTANTLYVFAVTSGALSVVASVVSLAPAATVVLGQLVFRERLNVAQKAGVPLALLAVVLLAQG